MEEMKLTYYAVPIEEISFSNEELVRMGILKIDGLENLKSALIEFGLEEYSEEISLEDYGIVLAKIGAINSNTWVIYSMEHSHDYVLDVISGRNFYKLVEETDEGTIVAFNRVRLRESYIEEDMEYYINLHLETKGPHLSSSEFLN